MNHVSTTLRPYSTASLTSFFYDALSQGMQRQGVVAKDETLGYLINMLTFFSRSENLFDYDQGRWGHQPLVRLYAQAVESNSDRERNLLLRRMGDLALFFAGLFAERLQRRRALVGVDYYIGMGGGAYGYLSECSRSPRDPVPGEVFRELAEQFARFVGVLRELRGDSTQTANCRVSGQQSAVGSQRSASGVWPVPTWVRPCKDPELGLEMPAPPHRYTH